MTPLTYELEILDTMYAMFLHGDIVEIRMMRRNGTVAGYYDYEHFPKCAHDVSMYDEMRDNEAVYYTCNPVKNELHPRAHNRLVERAKSTAGDKDIEKRTLLPIDIDPVRPTGTSSTDELHDLSIERAFEIKAWLQDNGFGDMIVADSGNGAHVDIFIDEPNTDESRDLVKAVQEAIIQKFNQPKVDKIDIQGFFNAARIWKLYGTKTRKGDEVPELNIRHRRSKILYKPETKEITTTAQLEHIANLVKTENTTQDAGDKPTTAQYTGAKFDIVGFMDKHGIEVEQEVKDRDYTRYRLKECPFNPDHKGKDVAIFQDNSGKLRFKCFHHSCADKHWSDVRELFEPGHKARVEEYKANRETAPRAPTPNVGVKPDKPKNTPRDDLFDTDQYGNCKLNYIAVAEMLAKKYNIISHREVIYVYSDGVYVEGSELIQTEIANISKCAGCNGGVRMPSKEIIHYLTYDAPEVDYPFNKYSDMIPVKNGIVKINFDGGTFALIPHNPAYKFNYKFDINYRKPRTSENSPHSMFNPLFIDYDIFTFGVDDIVERDIIDNVLHDYVNNHDVDILYQIPAQAILQALGSAPFKKAYLLQGDPHAAKSGYLELLLRLFGKDAHSHVPLQAIGSDKFALADLEGKTFNTYDDLSNVPIKDGGVFKTLTGGHEHHIQRKGIQGHNATITAVHVYTCNTPPVFDKFVQHDTAFWERWEYVAFTNTFAVDPFFYDKAFTKENLEKCFYNILDFVVNVKNNGLKVNSTAGEVREKWSHSADPLYMYIEVNMDESERSMCIDKDKLIQSYKRWCVSNDIDTQKIITTKKAFTNAADKYGMIAARPTDANGLRVPCYEMGYTWKSESRFAVDKIKMKTEQNTVI